MNVFDLFARISLDSSEYEKSLDEAGKKSTSFIDKLGSGLSTAATVGTAALTATASAVTAVGAGLVNATGSVAEYGDNIDKMSQKMGISAEAYQEWDAIMQHSGTSIEALKPSMKTLAQQAQEGSDAFQKLGISQEEVANLSQEDLFSKVISGLQSMEEGTERTALTSELLGRGAVELGALLNTSAEDTEAMRQKVHELGGVMSDEAVKASAAYQDSLQDMSTAFDSLSRNLMSNFLPGITGVMDGLTQIFSGDYEGGIEKISEGVDTVTSSLIEQLPKALEVGVSIIESVSQSILENIPAILPALVDLVMSISQMFIENLPLLVDTGIEIITQLMNGLTNALPSLMSAIANVIVTIATKLTDPNTILSFVNAALQMLIALADGFVKAIPVIVKALPQIIDNIIKSLLGALPLIIQAGITLFVALVDAMPEIIQTIVGVLPQIIDSIITNLLDNLPLLIDAGMELFLALITAMPEILVEIAKAIPQITITVVEALLKGVGKIAEAGGKLIGSLISGAKQKISDVAKMVNGIVSVISEGIGKAISGAITWGKDMIDNFINGIKNAATGVTDAIGDVAESIKGLLGFSEPDFGPLSNFHTYAPDMMKLFAKGIKDNEKLVLNQIKDSFDFSNLIGGLNPTAELSLATANTALRASTAQSSSTVPIVLNIDGRTLAKVLYPYNTAESQRRGLTIVTGG